MQLNIALSDYYGQLLAVNISLLIIGYLFYHMSDNLGWRLYLWQVISIIWFLQLAGMIILFDWIMLDVIFITVCSASFPLLAWIRHARGVAAENYLNILKNAREQLNHANDPPPNRKTET